MAYDLNSLKRISTTDVMLTATEARRMRVECAFDEQRRMDTDHVAELMEEMRVERFRPGTPISLAVLPNGKELLINGNHTVEAIARGTSSVPVRIERYKVRNKEEAFRIYQTFDIHKKRGARDLVGPAGLADVPFAHTAANAAAALFVANFQPGFKMSRVPTSVRFEIIRDYRAELTRLGELLRGTSNYTKMRQGPIVALAMATLRFQQKKAEEFWRTLSDDDGLRKGDPRHTFLRWLKSPKAYRNQMGILRAGAQAWNAYFRGLPIYRFSTDTPVFIDGTPWSAATQRGKEPKRRAA